MDEHRQDADLVLQVEHQPQRLAMPARRRQLVARQREEATVGSENQQLVGGLCGNQEGELVALLERQGRWILDPAARRADPAAIGENDGDRLACDQRLRCADCVDRWRVGKACSPRADPCCRSQRLAHATKANGHQLPLLFFGPQQCDWMPPRSSASSVCSLLSSISSSLANCRKASVEDRLGLDVADLEALDQSGLGLVLETDDADHLIEVEEDDQQAIQDVQALLDLAEPELRAPDKNFAAMIEERAAARPSAPSPAARHERQER